MILHNSFNTNEKGHLTIGGLDAVCLSREFGTPAYYLDCNAVRAMCRMYKSNFLKYFGEKSLPVYAGKALCFKGLYSIIAEEGLAADCVSSGELHTANAAGFPMDRVFFHGNNKTDADLAYAIRLGVGLIVVDGLDELAALDRIAGEAGIRQNILLRITPGIDPHTHQKIVTGNVDSKFGSAIMTGQAFDIVKAALACKNINLKGFHCHVGSQIFDIEPFSEAAEIMLAFIAKIKGETGYSAEILNIGGGFGVRYTEEDPEIDYENNIRMLGERFDSICREYGMEKPSISMEPGRSIVAAAGATLYTVGSVKEVTGFRNYVSVDGGMPDNPRYTLYQSKYTVVNAEKADAAADYECTLAGRCCESGDLLAEGIKIAKPQRGTILGVLVTGAYNYSMASNYNRIPRPPVIMIEDGKARVGVRRETFDDIIHLDI
ncbi:MAG: diaminopimelate decarboxylase [Ruminococcaceae bacterium]|nr:diaminopimelate decarboxylase [Oscillospiraceae bacterium]